MRKRQLLRKQQESILEEIAKMGPMRKGSVSEYFPTSIRKDGSRKSRGPYLVYTCKKKGKTRGKHLGSRAKAETYREQIAQFRRFEELVAEFAEVGERLADQDAAESGEKKGSRR